jgi:hypothetical protein
MAINIVDNLNIYAPKSIDNRYLKNGTTPYTSVNDVLASIEPSVRHIGLTVLINNEEYWFKNGILNNNLVQKITSSSQPSITGNTFEYIQLTNDPIIYEPFIGVPVFFEKEDYGDQVDEIDTNIAITRGNNQGIYNPYLEPGWDDTDNDGISPINTLWNKDGWDDLTNVSERRYFTFYQIFDGNIGNNVRNTELVMKDVTNDKYYKFYFTIWGSSWQGAPVTYTRQEINKTTGDNIGDEVQFVKLGYEDPTLVNDPIDTDLTLARGNNQGIYNIALEDSWSNQGDGENSPEGTLWNSDGWGNFRNLPNRFYTNFYDATGGNLGENVLNNEYIMFIPSTNKYYSIKFLSWTQNNNGGGFSYIRQELDVSYYFNRPDNDNTYIDIINDQIHIARSTNGGWLYNPLIDEGHDDNTPTGTLWNKDGWNDLSNLTERNYSTLAGLFQGNFRNIPGVELIMKDTFNNEYYIIKFIYWSQGNGGGFSYTRFKLDINQLNEGIKFADGSILKSSDGIGKVKARFAGGRRIEEQTGYIQVSVTEAITANPVNGTIYQDNNGSFDFYLVHTPELETLYDNQSSFTKLEFSFDQESTWKETVFGGGSRGNWWQFFFPNSEPSDYVTVLSGQTVSYRVTTGGEPVRWFNAEGDNFRGAIIDFHAYSIDAGTIIGTIHIADDDGDDLITHTETKSGSSDLENVDMWQRIGNEREIFFRRLDGEEDSLKIQWIAKMFYGNEFYD